MTGEEFQVKFCNLLWKAGYWALNIPRDRRGAQPFDVIAMKGGTAFALDCKVCKSARFPLSRIEDNQWTAFETVHNRTNASAGIAVYHDGCIYVVYYPELLEVKDKGEASIWITEKKPVFTSRMIELFEDC